MLFTPTRPEDDTRSDAPAIDPAFRADVLRGLGQADKAIPARWFYDMRGSQLFEAITQVSEYYPTRTETALLHDHAPAVAQTLGADATVVEFGSGSSIKTRILLKSMPRATYVPIDICGEFLDEACADLAALFPQLRIVPVEANFMNPVHLPVQRDGQAMLGFFPGSTIGNMTAAAAIDLLRSMRQTLGPKAHLLIGIDRVKDPQRLIAAYDDAQGVTALFNLNLLQRINRELGGTIPISEFRHVARWNENASRIEMHLEALRALRFEVAGQSFHMDGGETIHTENCHKYRPSEMRLLLAASGWNQLEHWTDPQEDFSLVLAGAESDRQTP
ncbi:L-histidine N(alpha)-methyltransferase [Novosphingobium sp. P6W]|uniref:L-histidine N(alpha)-methyltransferase n=1 Tax=Novosphingobium sp. P6W TaxID=1609758 RepID=UPI0005C2CB49|nr:L-histidine N(alpha)-methyltransferase [Novosphingobium sp. P6W]AXB75491.1 L-histidine N(alpha)-methyltransferase [Novosphingobium sp. P6W]KIS32487.1 methyltransferase [Novosphingobium sp. P6W]